MNVTREVITDLWPVYAADEASADTRALVIEFLKQDCDFAHALQGGDVLSATVAPPLRPNREGPSRRRTKWIVQGKDWVFFFARESS
jgi:hypothetical protein